MTLDERWEGYGFTQAYLEERAEWMSCDPRCPGTLIMYFQTAGSLMRFAWSDYKLGGLALFQTMAGLEGVLRLCFDDKETSFKELIERALTEQIISDQTFSERRLFSKDLSKRIEKGKITYAEKLVSLIRSLRNSYFHGEYVLFPECLYLAIQMREAADAVLAHKGWSHVDAAR
jgi:hypothetical protein